MKVKVSRSPPQRRFEEIVSWCVLFTDKTGKDVGGEQRGVAEDDGRLGPGDRDALPRGGQGERPEEHLIVCFLRRRVSVW